MYFFSTCFILNVYYVKFSTFYIAKFYSCWILSLRISTTNVPRVLKWQVRVDWVDLIKSHLASAVNSDCFGFDSNKPWQLRNSISKLWTNIHNLINGRTDPRIWICELVSEPNATEAKRDYPSYPVVEMRLFFASIGVNSRTIKQTTSTIISRICIINK